MSDFILALVAGGLAWLLMKASEATKAGWWEGTKLHQADDHPDWSPRRKKWNERWHAAGYVGHQVKTGLPDARHALVTGWRRSGEERAARRAEFDDRSNRASDRASDRAAAPDQTEPRQPAAVPPSRTRGGPNRATDPTGTVPPDRANDEPAVPPGQPVPPGEDPAQDTSDPFPRTVVHDSDEYPPIHEPDPTKAAIRQRIANDFADDGVTPDEIHVKDNGDIVIDRRRKIRWAEPAVVGRWKPNPSSNNNPAGPTPTPAHNETGGAMTAATGEVTNYDGHVAEVNKLIEVYQARVEAAEEDIRALTKAGSALDNLDAGTRDVHMDAKHLGFIGSSIEANASDLAAAKARRQSAEESLQAALAMRKDLQDRAGQVNQVSQATGHAADARYHQPA